jgi:hypothetical protein
MRARFSVVAALVIGGLLSGCPGELPKGKSQLEGSTPRDWRPWTQADTGAPVLSDLKAGGKADRGGTPARDKGPPGKVDQGPVVPGTCPCPPDQFCLNQKCYRKCTNSGPCNVDSLCADAEICIFVNNQLVWLCMPATAAPGGACDQKTLWCPNHYVCVYPLNATVGTCRPQCPSVGQPCPTGGTCTQYSGCLFCWIPP